MGLRLRLAGRGLCESMSFQNFPKSWMDNEQREDTMCGHAGHVPEGPPRLTHAPAITHSDTASHGGPGREAL